MMLIGRASRRENLLVVTGVEPMDMIRTHLANHIRASSREQWLHQQARHMTASDRHRRHANSALDAGAPSTHDCTRRFSGLSSPLAAVPARSCIIDREVTACNPLGLLDFHALHFRTVDDDNIAAWAFDLLFH